MGGIWKTYIGSFLSYHMGRPQAELKGESLQL